MTGDSTPGAPAENRITWLRRWTEAGAVWRVTARHANSVTVSLCTCDGGEEVDWFTSSEPALLRYIDAQGSAET
ncbi:hypothetical protein BH09ACT8_BH09ACT8_46550 [soil metagenome]